MPGADEWVQMLQMPRTGVPEPVREALNRERSKLRMRACCCPVLDDGWIFDSSKDDPDPVRQCPAPGEVLWLG